MYSRFAYAITYECKPPDERSWRLANIALFKTVQNTVNGSVETYLYNEYIWELDRRDTFPGEK